MLFRSGAVFVEGNEHGMRPVEHVLNLGRGRLEPLPVLELLVHGSPHPAEQELLLRKRQR